MVDLDGLHEAHGCAIQVKAAVLFDEPLAVGMRHFDGPVAVGHSVPPGPCKGLLLCEGHCVEEREKAASIGQPSPF